MTRLEQLAQVLAADEAAAERLFAMSAEAAAAKLGEQGYDFTADELRLFAEKLTVLTDTAEAELDEEALDEVSGGSPGALPALLLRLSSHSVGPIA